jgi:hypothetical protein
VSSRIPVSYSMTVQRGATWEQDFFYTEDDGVTPIDLTGYEARMQVRQPAGRYGLTTTDTLVLELTSTGAGPLLELFTPAGGTVRNGIRIRVSAAGTEVLNPDNAKKVKLVYGLELYRPLPAPDYVIPLFEGTLTCRGEVVR